MNLSTQIGIDKNLEKELINNKLFKTQLKSYLDAHISKYKELINMTDINFKIRDGTIASEFITTIGKITIYQDVKTESIMILQSNNIKGRSSEKADKRQMQNHN